MLGSTKRVSFLPYDGGASELMPGGFAVQRAELYQFGVSFRFVGVAAFRSAGKSSALLILKEMSTLR